MTLKAVITKMAEGRRKGREKARRKGTGQTKAAEDSTHQHSKPLLPVISHIADRELTTITSIQSPTPSTAAGGGSDDERPKEASSAFFVVLIQVNTKVNNNEYPTSHNYSKIQPNKLLFYLMRT